jgi:hypothetical protein
VVCTEVSLASFINARAAPLIPTVFDDAVDVLALDPVSDEAVVPVRDAGVVEAESEFDVTDEADACIAR